MTDVNDEKYKKNEGIDLKKECWARKECCDNLNRVHLFTFIKDLLKY